MARRAHTTGTKNTPLATSGSVTRTTRRGKSIKSTTRFLPEKASTFIKRRLIEIAGSVPILAALFIALSLISYNATDPSWNVSTTTPPQNWLGPIGSYLSDVLIQVLGLSACVLVFVLLGWGLRLVRHLGLPRFLLHLFLTPPATFITAMGLATLPVPNFWPLSSGLGGVAGHTALSHTVQALTPLGVPSTPWLYAPILLLLGLILTISAIALPLHDWRIASRALITGVWKLFYTAGYTIGVLIRFLWTMKLRIKNPNGKNDSTQEVAFPTATIKATHTNTPEEPDISISSSSDSTQNTAAHQRLKRPKRSRPSAESDEKLIKVSPPKTNEVKEGHRAKKEAQPELGFESQEGILPTLSLLQPADPDKAVFHNPEVLEGNARMLEEVLDDFGVNGDIVEVRPGPVVTVYELEPAKGTKTSRVIGLSDDIARSMSAISVRAAVIPGRSVIGIEIPNAERETVYLREMLASQAFENDPGTLNVVLGKDIEGEPVIADLAKMPHVLVAGTTGSGKSVGVNAMILSLLYQFTPEELRLIMVDPKILELSIYDDIPHLLTPVVTEPGKAVVALKWAVREMDDRYRQMSQLGVRNIASFNQRLKEASARNESLTREVQTGFDPETNDPIIEVQDLDLEPLPYIVIIVDEFADLMMMAGKDVEACVLRIAQKARAAGIHLIMATQRPSVDVVTGTIKANFPSRISFKVTAKQDSRTILGQQGSEQLLGMGDMLYMSSGGRLTRVHGPFVSDAEVEKVTDFLRNTGRPNYISSVTEEDEQIGGNPDDPLFADNSNNEDDLYQQAVGIVYKHKKASTSFIQRHLKIGYNRAARLIEQMEEERLISPPNHVGKREILMDIKN